MRKATKIFPVLLAALAGAFTATILTGVCLVGRYGGFGLYDEVTKYAAARKLIQERFVGGIDEAALTDSSISGAVTGLDDKWSYYMTAAEYESYEAYSKNRYTGIGITVLEREAGIEVLTVQEGTPAEKGGLQPGDLIIQVNGESAAGMQSIKLREILTEGASEVHFIINRAGQELELTVAIEEIFSDPVSSEMLDGQIGYVAIRNFEDSSGERAIEATEDLITQGAGSLVYDLRNNPGGKVRELLKILDHLLPEGDIFVSVSKSGKRTVDTSDAACVELPVVVLVNENTYSAAEYFAAVLMEYDWAEVVGTATTGKGRSQQTFVLPDGGALHISTNAYLTPEGVDLSLQGGIVPDFEVELSSDSDTQLEKAIQILS